MKIFVWKWNNYRLQCTASSIAEARLTLVKFFNLEDDFRKHKPNKLQSVDFFDVLLQEPEIIESQVLFYLDLSKEWQ